jgi:hypothetical protein
VTLLSSIRRRARHLYQRLTRGWDDSALWSLDYTLARLILPRFRAFVDSHAGYPSNMTEEEWDSTLREILWALEWYASDERWSDGFDKEERAERGMRLFGEHFGSMWT